MLEYVKKREFFNKLIKCGILLLVLLLAIKYRILLFDVMSPFLISALLAYLLNPIIQFLEKKGLKRIHSVILVYIIFLCILLLIGLVIVPKLFKDLSVLVENIPIYAKQFDKIYRVFQDGYINSNLPQGLKDIIDDNIVRIQNIVLSSLKKIADSLINFFSQLFNYIIVPVLHFIC